MGLDVRTECSRNPSASRLPTAGAERDNALAKLQSHRPLAQYNRLGTLAGPNLVIRLPNPRHRDCQRRRGLGNQDPPAAKQVSAFSIAFSTHPAGVSARAKISAGRPSILARSFPLVLVAPRL